MIDSEAIRVEAYRINKTGRWELEDYKTIDTVLEMPAFQFSLPLAEIYNGTRLA